MAALAALLVLAGVIGWRMLSSSEGGEAETAGGMSTPPGLAELQQAAEADADNPEAWQELALAHYSLNQYAEAAQAYERAVALDPESALLWSALGDSLAKASEVAEIPERAQEAFRRALAIDPRDPTARYFLAVGKDLDGDHEGAIADWLSLLADTPPGARWETDLVRTIQQVGAINQIEVECRIASASGTRDLLPNGTTGPARGPTTQQMAAAANLSPDTQQGMAETMVANLAQRIESQGGSVDEWVMLMRSYRQMGRTGEARRTRDRAIAAHPDARDQIMQLADQLDIG